MAGPALGRVGRGGVGHVDGGAERVGDEEAVDAGDGSHVDVDGDDEVVVAVDEPELDKQQPGQVLARRAEVAEVDRGVFELPEARHGHAAVGDRAGNAVTPQDGRRVGVGRGAQRRARRRELEGVPVEPALVVLAGGEHHLAGRYRPGAPDGAPGAPWDARQPLETLVEAEPEGEHPLRLAATAGLHFLRLLDEGGAGGYADAYVQRYRLPTAASWPPARGFLRIMAGRAPDGVALHQDLARAPGGLPAEPAIAPGPDSEAVLEAARRFRAWYAALAGPERPSPWQPERFEYAFAVAAPLRESSSAAASRSSSSTGSRRGPDADRAAELDPPGAAAARPDRDRSGAARRGP